MNIVNTSKKMPLWSDAFQKVLVDEPTVEDTIAILRGLKEKYEVHHGVDITDPGHRRSCNPVTSLYHRSSVAGQGH